MSVWTLVVTFESGSPYTFSVSPSCMPVFRPTYDEAQPPNVTGRDEVWDLEDMVLIKSQASGTGSGTLTTTANMIDEFVAQFLDKLSSPTNQVTKFEMKLDGTAKFTIGSATHHSFKVEEFSSPLSRSSGTAYLKMSMRITGTKKVSATVLGTTGITKAEIKYEYSGTGGFYTQQISGSIETETGTSAREKAIELFLLDLPSAFWFYDTDNPDNVHVTVEDYDADTKATATCRIVEQGEALPAGLHRFSSQVQEAHDDKGVVKTYSYSAQGPDAEGELRGLKPAGTKDWSISIDNAGGSATATYTVRESADNEKGGRTFQFTVTPGHYPKTYLPIMGSKVMHTSIGTWVPAKVQEVQTVEVYDLTSIVGIQFDAPLWPELVDWSSPPSETGPNAEPALEGSVGTKWTRSRTTNYIFLDGTQPDLQKFIDAVLKRGENQEVEALGQIADGIVDWAADAVGFGG